jgi:acyl carrier protein
MQSDEVEIEPKVIKVLSDYFSVGRRTIGSSSRLVKDLYVDSMDVVEVVMMLNEIFDVELPQSGVAGWRSVADIVSSVVRCKTDNKKLLSAY